MPTTPGPLSDLGAALRDARERAGLTQRELAAAMAVSRATVAEAELGADLRTSTLQRALDALPALSPGRSLGGGEGAPPVASQAVWRLQVSLCGFVVRRVVRALPLDSGSGELVTLAALGVRPVAGSLTDRALRRALMRAVYRGSAEALAAAFERDADEGPNVVEFVEGQRRHRFRFPPRPDREGFDYERFEPFADARPTVGDGPVSFTPGYAVETLELAFESSGEPVPSGGRYEAHAGGRRGDDDGLALARALRGEQVQALVSADGRRCAAEILRPEAYVAHEWHLEPEPREPEPEGLKAAREAAGWSCRELARRLGVSPMTVSNAESGRDSRGSTWRACLRELPGLSAEQVLRGGGPDRLATIPEAWAHERALHGLEADEEHKDLIIADDGWAEAIYRTRGLRSLRERSDGLIVRYGASRTQPPGRSTPPDTIEQDGPESELDDGFRTRLIRGGGGQVIHELRFSSAAAASGVSYTRRMARVWSYSLGADGAAAGRDGHGFAAAFPVKRLRVSVRFPAGFKPKDLLPHARPAFPVPGHDARLEAALHPDGFDLRISRRAGTAELVVDEPLVGVRYGLTWLPS